MPSLVTTWNFAADAQGLSDGGNHANIAFAHEPGDGSPDSGCVKFTTSTNNLNQATEYARRSSTGQTWETLGVPSGREVLNVQIIGWQQKVATDGGLQNFTLKARIIDSTGASVHSAGDLINSDAVPYTGGWETKGSGSLRAVDFVAQESTEDVRLELEFIVTTLIAGTSVDARFDSFELYIEYTDADGGSGGDNVAVPISNLDGLLFKKGFLTASRGVTFSDAIGMAALQDCELSIDQTYIEANGPESRSPLAVGAGPEAFTGTIGHLVFNAEQLVVFLGGSATYNAGTNKTTFTKLTDQEPNAFSLRLKFPEDGSDMEILIYKCLATNIPLIRGSANREFNVFGLNFRAYGQSTAEGKKLFEVITGGNQTGAS